MADCVVTGTTKNVQGAVVAGVKIYVKKTNLSGTVIQNHDALVAISNASGVICRVDSAGVITATEGFIVPQSAQVWLKGKFFIGSTDFDSKRQGIPVDISASSTVTLESLGAAVTGPTTGVTVQDNASPLANLINTFNFRNGFTVVESPTGVARIDADAASGGTWGGITGTLSDQTDLQSALDAKLAIASTSVYGRSLIDDADAAAARTTLGLGTAATQNTGAFEAAGSVASAIATHEAASNPHPGYLTQAEGDALYQALDSDLTTIGGLTPTNDDIIQRKAGAWINRTMAQLKTDLALVKGDVGLGNVSNVDQIPLSYLDTDTALAANSDVKVASQKAVKTYIDAAVVGLFDDRGQYDASGNVFPSSGGSGAAGAILKGDIWIISVSGTLGGAAVTVGDQVRALVDSPGQTASNWALAEANIGYVPLNRASNLSDLASASTARTNLGLVIGTDVQAWDADLDTISGLSASNDDFLQRKSGAWANRTIAQVKSDLGLTGTNSGDQNLFGSIIVAGQATVTASANPTALTLVEGSNVTITTNNTTKEITIAASGGGGGTPGGSDTQIQFNDGGSFGGDAGLVYSKTADQLTVGGSILTGSGAANSNTILHPEGPTSAESEQKIFVDHTSTTPAPGDPVDAFWPASILALTTVDISDDDDAEIDNLYRSSVAGTIRVPSSNDKDFSPLGHLSGVTAISLFEGTGSAPKVIGLYANAINTSPVEIIYGAGAQVLNDGNATYSAGIGVFAEAHSGATIGELVGADVYVSPSSGSVVTDTFGVRISHAAGAGAATNLYGLVIEDFSGGGAVTRNENFRSKGSTSVNVFEGALISGAASPPTLSNGQFTFHVDDTEKQIIFTMKDSLGDTYSGAVQLA